jgi:hypothetical protein
MQFECNQYDGLSLATDRKLTHKTVVKYYNTREILITDSIVIHLGTFSTLMKVEYTYVTNQTLC